MSSQPAGQTNPNQGGQPAKETQAPGHTNIEKDGSPYQSNSGKDQPHQTEQTSFGDIDMRIARLETAMKSLLGGRPTITGAAAFQGGISTGTGGLIGTPGILQSTQTWSGANTFTSNALLTTTTFNTATITVSTGSSVVYGGPGVSQLGIATEAVWAYSIDGATESSGCVVAVEISSSAALAKVPPNSVGYGQYIFTSTTTNLTPVNTGVMAGVLLETNGITTCAPKTWCRVGLAGTYWVNASVNIGANWTAFSTTRCQVTTNATFNGNQIGEPVSNQGAGNAVGAGLWMRLIVP